MSGSDNAAFVATVIYYTRPQRLYPLPSRRSSSRGRMLDVLTLHSKASSQPGRPPHRRTLVVDVIWLAPVFKRWIHRRGRSVSLWEKSVPGRKKRIGLLLLCTSVEEKIFHRESKISRNVSRGLLNFNSGAMIFYGLTHDCNVMHIFV